MTTKLLQYTDNDLTFLLLNIIGHDPIHDFGDPTPLRWGGIVSTIREFDTVFNTQIGGKKIKRTSKVGGVENIIGSTLTMPTMSFFSPRTLDTPENIKIANRPFKKGVNLYDSRIKRRIDLTQKNRSKRTNLMNENRGIVEYETSIFSEPINTKNNNHLNSLINNFVRSLGYHSVLSTLLKCYQNRTQTINIWDLYVFIRDSYKSTGTENTEYIIFFKYISDLFLYFISSDNSEDIGNRLKISDYGYSEPIEHPIDLISYFFAIYEDEINTLFYLLASTGKFKGSKSLKIKGGSTSFEQMDLLVQNLQGLIISEEFINLLNQLEQLSHNDFIGDDDKRNNLIQYNEISENIRKYLIGIYVENSCEHLYTKFFTIRELTFKPFNRKYSIKTAILQSIEESLKTPRKIIAAEKTAMRKIDEARAAEARAAESGTLSPTDKKIFVTGFVKMIASFALTLYGYDINYVPNTGLPILDHQINILKYQIGGRSLVPQNMTDDLDSQLLDFYTSTNYYLQNVVNQKTKCNFNNYLSNNAADVGSLLNKTLCNQASRIDGMSQCSRNSAIDYGTESGVMNFTLTNPTNTYGYNGVLTPVENIGVTDIDFSINLEINIFLPRGKITGKKLNIPVNKPDTFKAVIALGNSVKTILLSVVPFLTTIDVGNVSAMWDAILQNMYSEIHDPLIDPSIDQNTTIYNLILRELLFKGTGDFFQEINAVCKNGGYVSNPIYSNNVDNTIKYYGGDAVRFFAANDRPSAVRFMHMLINGSTQQINMKAFGGYISQADEIVVKRIENTAICASGSISGGKNKTRKRKRKRASTVL
jgi:hypothetical protein